MQLIVDLNVVHFSATSVTVHSSVAAMLHASEFTRAISEQYVRNTGHAITRADAVSITQNVCASTGMLLYEATQAIVHQLVAVNNTHIRLKHHASMQQCAKQAADVLNQQQQQRVLQHAYTL
eukprot:15539-Heterococcus_DN1.PRE.7